ncbi:hypothetical protein PYW07_016954 [Mythimna separata]|uniref:Lipocalin/cytosolic fatty-acid binding domain-containing protein n=1 Tax=Mythimna separata TaxID=271217 RepID=A0AAD7YVG7_MYTSE|nr:hypothetical protein PYW07_016954 [Mythimna separata]
MLLHSSISFVTDSNQNLIKMLTTKAPIFSFTCIDENTFNFTLQMPHTTMTHVFKLGEETEVVRRDGSKVIQTNTLESDNVLKQVMVPTDGGRVTYFRWEFVDKEAKMTIKMEGSDIEATVYYEEVD